MGKITQKTRELSAPVKFVLGFVFAVLIYAALYTVFVLLTDLITWFSSTGIWLANVLNAFVNTRIGGFLPNLFILASYAVPCAFTVVAIAELFDHPSVTTVACVICFAFAVFRVIAVIASGAYDVGLSIGQVLIMLLGTLVPIFAFKKR